MIADLENLIKRTVLRMLGERRDSCLGYVSSYNPKTYSVKVMLQPWDVESGWLPMGALHVGNGFGIYAGPNIGDQVMVGFIKNEPAYVTSSNFMSGNPLAVPAGEIWIVHASGAYQKLTNDGALAMHSTAAINIGNLASEVSALVTAELLPYVAGHTHLVTGSSTSIPVQQITGITPVSADLVVAPVTTTTKAN